MKLAILVLLLLALSSFAFAQHLDTLWTRSFFACAQMADLAQAKSLEQTRDGGFVMALENIVTYHGSYYRSGVIKMNAHGDVQWTICDFSSPYPLSYASDVRGRPDGSLIAVGQLRSFGTEHIWMLNDSGGIEWTRSWGSAPMCVRALEDGGFVLCGTGDYSVSRADSNGNPLWHVTLPAEMTKVEIVEGGYVAVGTTTSQGTGGRDFYLVRLNANGDTLWTRTYGTEQDEDVRSLCVLPSGGYLLVGQTEGAASFAQAYMVRTTDLGDTLWTRRPELTPENSAADATPVWDGTIMLAIQVMDSTNPYERTMLVHLSLAGDTLWTQDVSVNLLAPQAIVQTSDSGLALLGNTYGEVMCLVRFAPYRLRVDKPNEFVAHDLHLSVFPNPFNPSAMISFSLPHEGRVRIAVFDLLGREVEVLADRTFPSGEHRIAFNGSALPSGLYFARLHSGDLVATQKLLLLK